MKTIRHLLTAGVIVLLPLALSAARVQEKPTVVRENLPKKAVCFVCSQNGEEHGEEKPAGAVAYRGKVYYFCSKKEIEAFLKDPDMFLPAPVPRPAPSFTLKTPDGQTRTISTLGKDRVLLVDFWATWCGPCVKAMPELQKLHEKHGAGGKFSVVGISLDEGGAKTVSAFLSKNKTRYTYPLLLDDQEVWTKWGVKALPTMVLVRDGRIIRHWSGKIDLKVVERDVLQALQEINVPPSDAR